MSITPGTERGRSPDDAARRRPEAQPHEGVSVIVPCYNEEYAIGSVLDELERVLEETGRPHEIIVVDDGSSDRSAEAIDEERFRLIRHPLNLGYGAALKSGALAARFDTLVITDADGTYPNHRIPELLDEANDADMVVGARSGANAHIPLVRRPAKWIIRQLAAYLINQPIPDINSGLRVIRRDLWERFENYYPNGFSLTTTVTLAALTRGYRVRYLPIEYHHRVGTSKIRPIRDTLNFTQLILRTVLYFDPLRIFVPVSLALVIASAAVGVISKLMGEFLDTTTILLFAASLQVLAIGMLADLINKRLG